MNAGEVVHIRVSPQDVMTAIDIIDLSQLNTLGMSLASVVKWAMVFAFESLRRNGTVPERTGFEYEQMVRRFSASRASKAAVGQALSMMEAQLQASDRGMKLPDGLAISQLFSGQLTEDESDNEIVVPPAVKMKVPYIQVDIIAITHRLQNHDVNVTAQERAKWLMYAPGRGGAELFMTKDEIVEAEGLIRDRKSVV